MQQDRVFAISFSGLYAFPVHPQGGAVLAEFWSYGPALAAGNPLLPVGWAEGLASELSSHPQPEVWPGGRFRPGASLFNTAIGLFMKIPSNRVAWILTWSCHALGAAYSAHCKRMATKIHNAGSAQKAQLSRRASKETASWICLAHRIKHLRLGIGV